MPEPTLKRAPGGYDVFVDGELIGRVRKWERRYNLRRVYVSRGWRARHANGDKVTGDHADAPTGRTRADAVDALIADWRERQP